MSALPSGTVTFLFTDIEGSTKLAQDYSDETPDLLTRHNEILNQAIEKHNGYVFQIVGDSFSAAFHNADDALSAALNAQRTLQTQVWSPAPIKVRMGIHTGAAQLQDASNALRYSGYATIALTQRIMSAGHGGQVLVSQAVKDLTQRMLPPDIKLRDLGDFHFKDFAQTEQIYQLVVPDLVDNFPPLKTFADSPHNLPHQPTPFIGRERELAELDKLISDPKTRLVTIVGPGGMGKTRLALATAERIFDSAKFPDGIFFVDLTPLNEARQIPLAVAEVLQIQLSGGGEAGADQQLLNFLSDKAMLFILDNFEHVLEGAQLVNAMLATTLSIRVLITSRERLGLRGEQLFQISGLDFTDWINPEDAVRYSAAQLFLGAARRLRSDFTLTEEDLSYLTRICQLVDGMPLALELAAGWVEMLSISEIADEIERGLAFLKTELQDIPDRQRSMQAVFESAWERLEPVEQDVLRKLSVFRGGFKRNAATRVAGVAEETASALRLLGRLLNKNLLQANLTRERYQLHELLRQYAWERLEGSGVIGAIRTAHAGYFLELLQRREADIKGGREQKQALDEIEADFANIRSAWYWALTQGNLEAIDRSLESLFWFFWFQSRQVEGMTFLERTLNEIARNLADDSRLLQRRLSVRRLYFDRGANLIDPSEKLREAQKILVDAQKEGSKDEIAFAFHTLGHAQIDFQALAGFNFPEIEQSFVQSLSIYRELNEHFYESQVLDWLSTVFFSVGQPEERVRIARQRLEMAEKSEDRLTIADATAQIGVDHEMAGRYDEAEEEYKKALPVFQEYGDRWHQTEYLLRVAGLAFLRGELDYARTLAEEGQATVIQYNLNSVWPYVIEHLGIIRCADEDYDQVVAFEDYEQVVGFKKELASNFYPPAKFGWFRGLTYAYCGLGDFSVAVENLRKALEAAISVKAIGWQVQCLPATALIAANKDQLERAAELLSLAFHHPTAVTGWLEKFPLVSRLRARLRAELSQDVFYGAWERGKDLDLVPTITYALEEN